jgi:flagellar basal body rod protein FlgG
MTSNEIPENKSAGQFFHPAREGFASGRVHQVFPSGKSVHFCHWHSRCSTTRRMNVSLYQAAAAMNAQSQWQEMIADNLASAAVPGYCKQAVSFEDVQARSPEIISGVAPASFYVPVAKSATSFQQGELRPTGNSMDFALEGPGFFEVQLPNGQLAYTRNGQFQLNAKSQLVNSQGDLVLSESGPIQLDPNNNGALNVSPDGQVKQGSDIKGQLRVVNFSDPGQLTMTTGGMLINTQPDMKPVPAGNGTAVRQGFLESANTSPTMEMSQLITAMRMFEANQKVLQMQDSRMGQIITDLGGAS